MTDGDEWRRANPGLPLNKPAERGIFYAHKD